MIGGHLLTYDADHLDFKAVALLFCMHLQDLPTQTMCSDVEVRERKPQAPMTDCAWLGTRGSKSVPSPMHRRIGGLSPAIWIWKPANNCLDIFACCPTTSQSRHRDRTSCHPFVIPFRHCHIISPEHCPPWLPVCAQRNTPRQAATLTAPYRSSGNRSYVEPYPARRASK